MKKCASLFLLFFNFVCVSLNAQWQWASTIPDSGNSTIVAMTLDDIDNVYVTGYYKGRIIIDGDTSLADGYQNDIFVAKYDASGNLVWISTAGGVADDQGRGIALDESGNVYVAGSFMNSISLENHTLTSMGGEDMFVAKYTNNGSVVWVKSFGGAFHDVASRLMSKNDGYLYMAGWVMAGSSYPPVVPDYATIDLDTFTLTSYGGGDVFLAKLDTEGNMVWVNSYGGRRGDYVYALTVDGSGHCYLGGTVTLSKSYFDNDSLVDKGAFILKCDNLGNVVWVRGIDRQDVDIYMSAIGVDSDGNVFVSGQSTPEIAPKIFAPGIMVSEYAYLAKYSSNGDVLWAKGLGPINYTEIWGMEVDDDNVYFSGYFRNKLQIAGDTINAYGSDDIFLNKYDNDGNHVWTVHAGGTGSDQGSALAMDSNGDFIVGGFTASAAAHFGNIQAGSQGMRDAFVAKYSQGNMGVVENMVGDPSFGLFPNPTSGIFSIRSDASQYTRYAVFNLQGQKLQEGNIHADITTLNLSHLPSGLYAVVLSGKDRTVSPKLNLTR